MAAAAKYRETKQQGPVRFRPEIMLYDRSTDAKKILEHSIDEYYIHMAPICRSFLGYFKKTPGCVFAGCMLYKRPFELLKNKNGDAMYDPVFVEECERLFVPPDIKVDYKTRSLAVGDDVFVFGSFDDMLDFVATNYVTFVLGDGQKPLKVGNTVITSNADAATREVSVCMCIDLVAEESYTKKAIDWYGESNDLNSRYVFRLCEHFKKQCKAISDHVLGLSETVARQKQLKAKIEKEKG
jgi:hypothetical protein